MKVLVIGGGGREHTLVWKISQSKKVKNIYCAPGNAGITGQAECIPIKADDTGKLASWADQNKIDLTIVGPELPLTLGIVDEFETKGLRICGPHKSASVIEGSKIFAKDLMKKNVMTIRPQEKLTKAASIMKQKNISQMPVIEKERVIGTISEREISNSISMEPKKLLVKDVMSDPPPLVSINTTVEMLSDMLDHYPPLLVTENGKIRGILCRADLLRLVKR